MTALDLDAIQELLERGLTIAGYAALTKELLTECQRLDGELIRETHGHAPGLCDKYRCAFCRYCGQEKPCSCYTADGRFRGFSIALPSPEPVRKDLIEGALISAVSTIAMFDADGYETAVGLPLGGFEGTGQWHPVERYETLEDAMEGHARWLAAAPTLTEVTDLGLPGSEPAVVDLVAELARMKKGS
jgi:hypothetical protein